MMDPTRVVPNGFHRCKEWLDDDLQRITVKRRCKVAPVRYFLIDFGLSRHYPEGRDNALCVGVAACCKTVPELSNYVPYNPFKTDVYMTGILGWEMASVRSFTFRVRNMSLARYSRRLSKKYEDLHVFKPVFLRMTEREPRNRPSIDEVLSQFEDVVAELKTWSLRNRIWRISEKTFSDRLQIRLGRKIQY